MGEFLDIAEDKGIEAVDFIIDKITESKYFDGFPIISQVLGVIKAARVIPNYLYAKKTCAFLDGLKSDDMDCDTFSKAMKELNQNPRKFEEELLFLIEKAENAEKANLLGYFTRLFALHSISFDLYIFFTYVINNIQLSFLKQLSIDFTNKNKLSDSTLTGVLQSQGFVTKLVDIKDGNLNIGAQYSKQLDIFGQFLSNYFKEKE